MTASDWRPEAALSTLRLRAELLAATRRFFARRGVLEVTTPVLSGAATTAPELHSFRTRYDGPGGPRDYYLQTSPEFAMKRLLAAYRTPIYQLATVFRNGETGAWHNPEFTLLEWYRPGLELDQLIDEVDALVRELLSGRLALAASERMSYRRLFRRHLGLDPHRASAAELAACAAAQRLSAPATLDAGAGAAAAPWLDLLLTHCIEPRLAAREPPSLLYVYDYPAGQAALARLRRDAEQTLVAARFELYLGGVELANGFDELTDPDEQRQRFESDNAARRAAGLPELPIDRRLLAALSEMPPSAGVALGFDRLLMLAAGAERIGQVLAFASHRS